RKLRDLVVAYAESQGGVVLDLAHLLHGVFWGRPLVLTFDQSAVILNRPEAELKQIFDDMMLHVKQDLVSSAEYQLWQAGRTEI
ncbi:MAG: hypothetical protein LC721_12570, partial [Actinobacteria bacterium]|nr:hypothetical protein [Actinomycetota bacterium]